MIRRPDWEQGLSDYLSAHGGAVFAWGERDCVLFASGAVAAMTGDDPAEWARGHYRTRIGSLRALHRAGFASLAEAVASVLEPVPPARAHRGDIVMADGSLGICVGTRAFFIGEDDGVPGLITKPFADWTHAWRVPFATG